jgi:hypothetical protein
MDRKGLRRRDLIKGGVAGGIALAGAAEQATARQRNPARESGHVRKPRGYDVAVVGAGLAGLTAANRYMDGAIRSGERAAREALALL